MMNQDIPLFLSGEPITRRRVLRNGALAAAGLFFGSRFGFSPAAAAAAAPETQLAGAKAKAVIQVWLGGGPSHLETFDPKPEAGSDYHGPMGAPVATNVDGIQLSELMPELAKHADKYSLLRGMTHGSNGHETAAYMVQTGHAEGGRIVYPSMGAVVSLLKGYGGGYKGLVPPYIVLTQPQGRFSEAGFLGPRYKPFATGGDPSKPVFAVEGIVADGISRRRQEERRNLLHQLDTLGQAMQGTSVLAEFNQSEEGAYDMILGDGGKVFDLSQEGQPMRDWYGKSKFGQSCLAARRLVEQGVKYVTINFGGWDTHKQNFPALRTKVPQLDQGLAALIADLHSRGLLESTIVWVCGEFGRTPKVQWEAPWNGGRGHWGKVFSALIAGGGFKGGQVVGESDAKGEEVKDRPIYPWDLLPSMYTQLGIDPNATFPKTEGEVRITQPLAADIKSGGLLKEIM